MASKCCNVDLVPIVILSTPMMPDSGIGFSAFGSTQIEQFCSKCGKLDRTESTPHYAPEFCKEAIL